MFWFKSCFRCGTGDLYQGRDQSGAYIACLQCGHHLTEAEEVVLRYAAGDAALTLPEAIHSSSGSHGAAAAGRALAGVR
jgi:hypothetical protein